jgi:DNA repair protein RadC
MTQRLRIKDWSEDERPREKLMKQGGRSLSDAELLAILIASGNDRETAVELSRRILHSCGNNLDELGKIEIGTLIKNFKGIGEAKAITIAAALELGRRRKSAEPADRLKITSSSEVFDFFYPTLRDLQQEEFWMILLNRANRVIAHTRLTQGGTGQTVVEIPLVLKTAISHLANSIIVCHNHPSGNTTPSQADTAITQKLASACKAIDISLLDHIIIGGGSYYSFADSGLI